MTAILLAVAVLAASVSAEPRNLRGENPREAYFRKSVNLPAKPKSAVVRIFSDTGYELWRAEVEGGRS